MLVGSLAECVTNEELDEKLGTYAVKDELKDYAKTSAVLEAMSDYATKAMMTQDIEAHTKQVAEQLAGYYTRDEVDTSISDFRTESQISEMVSDATADFVASDEIDERIATATENLVESDEIDSRIVDAVRDFVASDDIDSRITDATKDFVSSADIDTRISDAVRDGTAGFITAEALAPYATSEEVSQKIAAIQTTSGGKPVITEEEFNLYVNSDTGSDDNDGMTAAKAFATIERAMQEAIKYSFGFCQCNINLAGTFTPTLQAIPRIDSVVSMCIIGATGTALNLSHEAALYLANGAIVKLSNVTRRS